MSEHTAQKTVNVSAKVTICNTSTCAFAFELKFNVDPKSVGASVPQKCIHWAGKTSRQLCLTQKIGDKSLFLQRNFADIGLRTAI